MGESRRKKTFHMLDGLRGVAALMVTLFHLTPLWTEFPVPPSAYLSVDLFFMLSGFVMGHAYHDRLAAGLPFVRFFRLRLIRLYPLYVLGCLAGLATPVAIALLSGNFWVARPAVYALPWAILMLPQPVSDPAQWFLLNPPAWSLTYEMLLCLAYASTFRWLGMRVLLAIVAVSAVLLAVSSIRTGSVNVAGSGWWGWAGLSRPIFSFAMGLLLQRLYRDGAWRAGAVRAEAAVVLFLGLILVPPTGAGSGLISAMVVILGLPVVLMLGLADPSTPRSAQVSAVAGELSYALYALHWPVIMAVVAIGPAIGASNAAMHLAAMSIALLAACLAAQLYDHPIRALAALRMSRRAAPVGAILVPAPDGNSLKRTS